MENENNNRIARSSPNSEYLAMIRPKKSSLSSLPGENREGSGGKDNNNYQG
jgi:hypothetical protein